MKRCNYVVSVIVLTYQSELYIHDTIYSILNQQSSYPFEVVISDDNSTDYTLEILSSFIGKYSNIFIYKNNDRRGIISNFKNAINNCTGSYICYCGHDDYWHNKKKMQIQVDFLMSNKDYGLVYTDFDILNSKTNKIIKNYNTYLNNDISRNISTQELINNYNICSCTPCFRKDVFDKFVPINNFVENDFPVEDWCTYLVISIYSKIMYLAISTATFRVGHISESNSQDIAKTEDYMEKHEKMYKYFLDNFPLIFRFPGFKEQKIYKYKALLSTSWHVCNFEKAKYYSIKLSQLDYYSLKTTLARFPLSFYIFYLIKKIYSRLSML
ncbi:glycosyltransferase [Larkinella punicea]|uniref:Glycosyltransferase n=1 Tax=Larkinella punicea TaxID=2315727 RepID=A0A368JIY8_9BACT|nr:glycosyltransferase [Larkinella punicea]RCR67619.1 glycosyltransferase [Larkinella punicea]